MENDDLRIASERARHIRRFAAVYCEGHDGSVTYGQGVVWDDGQVALHWHRDATLCFKSEADLRVAYGREFVMQFIDEENTP